MGEKTWIKVRCGILEKKHREKMGACIWLYLYLLDNVDWDTGKLVGWKDGDHAEAMELSIRTLQGQRQKLQDEGYITCRQVFQSQTITILRWINPRSYSGKVQNDGTQDSAPSEEQEEQGTDNRVPMGAGFSVPMVAESSVPLHIVHIKNHIKTTYKIELPDELDHRDFQDTWFEWEAYRKQKRKPLTPAGVKMQIKNLSAYPREVVIKAIESSIANEWQGIFPEKYTQNRANGKPSSKPSMMDILNARIGEK